MTAKIPGGAGPITRRTGVAMIKAVTNGGKKIVKEGVVTADVDRLIAENGGSANRKQEAARWLRTLGVPIMATRRRHLTRWWVAPHDSPRHNEWVDRVLSDAYAEACRAYCALLPYEEHAAAAVTLKQSAITIGTHLGKRLRVIETDLEPSPMPEAVEAMLRKIGVLP